MEKSISLQLPNVSRVYARVEQNIPWIIDYEALGFVASQLANNSRRSLGSRRPFFVLNSFRKVIDCGVFCRYELAVAGLIP